MEIKRIYDGDGILRTVSFAWTDGTLGTLGLVADLDHDETRPLRQARKITLASDAGFHILDPVSSALAQALVATLLKLPWTPQGL